MNLYSRALRHIDMDDVKRRREEKIAKQKIIEEVTKNIAKQIEEELKRLDTIEFSNWRKELNEQMTTAAIGVVNLDATGDVDIVDTNTTFDNIDTSQNLSRSGDTVTLAGDSNNIVGGTHTAYRVARFLIDGTKSSTLKITISKGGGTTSWTDRGESWDDNVSLNINNLDDILGPSYYNGNLGSGTHLIPLPGNYERLYISIEQFAKVASDGSPDTTGSLTVTNVSLQRRTPVSVFVGLDSPEASAFIRTEPTTSNLSPAQKEKRLKEMIAASDEYLAKMFGDQFPGTGAVAPKEVAMPKTFAQMKLDKDVAWLKSMGKGFTQGYLSGLPSSEANAIRRAMGMPVSKSSNPLNDLPDYERAWLKQMGPAFTQGYLGMQPKAPSTPPANASKPQVSPETLANIEASLKQLEIDKQMDKEAANRRAWEYAAGLGMDVVSAAGMISTILSPPLGDEVAMAAFLASRGGGQLAKQGGGQLVKQGAKQTAKQVTGQLGDDAMTLANTLSRGTPAERALAAKIEDAVNNGAVDLVKSLSKQGRSIMRGGYRETIPKVQGPSAAKPYRIDPRNANPRNFAKFPRTVSQSYEPQGQVLSEKKLKSPKEILNKIPGYYDGKPAPLGFPETPPPEMKNGMHPDLVDGKKVSDRFNRLDPQSAKAMPLTGNPHIDKKVKAARKKSK